MIMIGPIIIVVNNWPEKDKGAAPVSFDKPTPPAPRDPSLIYRDCECGWWGSYKSEGKANMGMASHKQWCKRGRGVKTFW